MTTPAKPLKVLIVGAGIAGPVCAFFLNRLKSPDFPTPEITILERAPSPRISGQAVDIRGAARTVVRRMGLEDEIKAECTKEAGIKFVDGKGRTRAEFKAGGLETGEGNGGFTAEIEILRGDLSRVFYDATKGKCEYIFGDYVTALEEKDEGVVVSFAESKEKREFDIVIAGDGQGSKTRRLVFGAEDSHVRSLGQWTTYFTVPYEPHDEVYAKWYNAPGRRCILIRPDNKTPRGTRAYLSIIPKEGSEAEAELKAHTKMSAEEQKKMHWKLFEDAGWEAKRVLKGMDSAEDYYMQSIVQVRMETWHKGRIALLGDAAYCPSPISGMGTSLAIVGAYVLAGEIGQAISQKGAGPKSVMAAFEAYETKLRPYVTKAQDLPPGAPKIANPETAWGIAILNGVLAFFSKSGLASLLQYWLGGEKAEAINIEEGYGSMDGEKL